MTAVQVFAVWPEGWPITQDVVVEEPRPVAYTAPLQLEYPPSVGDALALPLAGNNFHVVTVTRRVVYPDGLMELWVEGFDDDEEFVDGLFRRLGGGRVELTQVTPRDRPYSRRGGRDGAAHGGGR